MERAHRHRTGADECAGAPSEALSDTAGSSASEHIVESFDGCELRVTTTPAPGVITLALHGELDLATAGPVLASMTVLVRAGAWRGIQVDVKELTFLDARGISALIALRLEAEDAGSRFGIVGTTPRFRRVVELAGATLLMDCSTE